MLSTQLKDADEHIGDQFKQVCAHDENLKDLIALQDVIKLKDSEIGRL